MRHSTGHNVSCSLYTNLICTKQAVAHSAHTHTTCSRLFILCCTFGVRFVSGQWWRCWLKTWYFSHISCDFHFQFVRFRWRIIIGSVYARKGTPSIPHWGQSNNRTKKVVLNCHGKSPSECGHKIPLALNSVRNLQRVISLILKFGEWSLPNIFIRDCKWVCVCVCVSYLSGLINWISLSFIIFNSHWYCFLFLPSRYAYFLRLPFVCIELVDSCGRNRMLKEEWRYYLCGMWCVCLSISINNKFCIYKILSQLQ